jgi:hypothetical protein
LSFPRRLSGEHTGTRHRHGEHFHPRSPVLAGGYHAAPAACNPISASPNDSCFTK